jgi:signal transduction histidine kinase
MKRFWFPISIVAVLLILLGALAGLQYRWLGKISDDERERMQKRLEIDAQRFAEDFNREIQNAYFNFQLDATVWREKNWGEFNLRYEFWREKTVYQNLVRDFYFIETDTQTVSRFNRESRVFELAQWTENLNRLKPKLFGEANSRLIAEEIPALLLPIHDAEKGVRKISIPLSRNNKDNPGTMPTMPFEIPQQRGVLVIELDASVIKNQILPELVNRYFHGDAGNSYKLAVTGEDNQSIFQTGNLTGADANVKIFNLSPENLIFFANRNLFPKAPGETKQSVVFSRVETRTRQAVAPNKTNQIELQVLKNEKPQVRIFNGENLPNEGVWQLKAQHSAGSIEQFVLNERCKNLAVSFGILLLLAVSVCLIFVSAWRAKLLAQRQMDFVSAVSHEFRTPLAVIRSAGENLTDGVVQNADQIAQYGALIKREGVKLSAMVEQILEFAGARSGKRRYDLRRETEVEKIIENALAECEPLIKEKAFTVEKEIAENLPTVTADEKALTQAIQNLIVNSVKYSNGNSRLKISATNGGGQIKICVEDRGIGIAAKDLKHIFEPFYRSKVVVDEQIHGSGLGLSLVRQTVAAHGGKINVESEIGKGSRFTIELKSEKAKK